MGSRFPVPVPLPLVAAEKDYCNTFRQILDSILMSVMVPKSINQFHLCTFPFVVPL